MRVEDLPDEVRVWRLLKLGVSLTEQGIEDTPAPLLDWLLELETRASKVANEKANARER